MKDMILNITQETIETLGFICVEAVINISKNMRTLKAVIYKDDADVTMDDCSSVANVIIRRLDVEIPQFSETYDVIVESPGVDRKLKTIDEVKIFQNKEIRFVLKSPQKFGLKDNVVVGRVSAIDGGRMTVIGAESEMTIEIADCSSIRLYFDIKKYL